MWSEADNGSQPFFTICISPLLWSLMLEQVWRPNLEVAGLLGTHGRTDEPALVLNAFESVLCGKGVSLAGLLISLL